MKFKLTILLCTMVPMIMVSCINKAELCCTNIDISVGIYVKDSDGGDRFHPEHSNPLDVNNIKLLYVINGETVEFYEGHLDHPKGFFITEDENGYRMNLFPNHSDSEPFPVTLIRWEEGDVDTLTCEFSRNGNSIIVRKVWFNDELKWEAYDSGRIFTIEK